jgi:VWFA-related protein
MRSLTTSGVFGPILGVVLIDAARSKLAWSHWEQGPTGLQAVFSYEVPKENSHYTLTYDSIPTNPGCSTTPQTFSKVVAYHGKMAIDPASGTILRLMLLADMTPDEFIVNSGIEVEYGQVSIGGKDYFLPIRSVTSSLAHSLLTVGSWEHGGCPSLAVTPGLQKSLNDGVFENYHVFRADAIVLADSEAARLESQPSPAYNNGSMKTEPANASPLTTAPSAKPLPPSGSQAAPSASTTANSVNPLPSESQPTVQPAPYTAESAPPVSPAADIPNTPVFRTAARQVLVDVVVDKRNGAPVSGLLKSDFSIEEGGKPQTIDFFEEHSASVPAPAAPPAMPPLPPGAVTNVPKAPPSGALYVLLLDSLNSEPQDQVYVRKLILAFLHKLDPGTQVAVFSLASNLRLLQGFTSDPAALLAAVGRTHAERGPVAQTRSDNADDADSIANLEAMRSNGVAALQAAQANAHAYSFGTRASMTFEALNALARYLEGIPGRKNLVWFASSFPVVFFPTPVQFDQLKNNRNLPGYVNHIEQTANLFTLSRIAVYRVSGAGIMNSNIGLADSSGAGSAGGTGHFGTAASPTSSLAAEALNSGAAVAGMEQLAGSTGGRAFTTNDIDAALRSIVHDGDVYYTVGYSPSDSATDGGFRRIDVKVNGGKYKLAYRQGYNADSASTDGAPSVDPIAPLLKLGLPNATGILYGASGAPSTDHSSEPAGQNAQVTGPLTRYTVSFTIRAEDVFFGQAPNGERIANLLIGIKAYAEDGSALNWQATREAAQLSPAQYASITKTGLPVSLDLDLPANTSAQLVTAVYDWNTNRSGTLEIPSAADFWP